MREIIKGAAERQNFLLELFNKRIFAATRDGKVISLKDGKFLRGAEGLGGYRFTTLSYGRRRATFSFHQIVWVFFNGSIPTGMEINHINGKKSDGRLANLECCTHQENIQHADRTGLRNVRGEACKTSKLKKADVLKIREMLRQKINQREIAQTFGVAQSTVQGINVGRIWGSV